MVADIRCLHDMDPYATETEDPLELLEQDTFHFLTLNPGANPDAPDRGINLPAMLSGVFDKSIELAAQTEVQKDDRVAAVEATLTTGSGDQEGIQATIDVKIQPTDPNLGPLKLSIPTE